MTPFDFQPLNRVVFGAGALGQLGDMTRELGARRVLLVTDPGVRAAGHVDRALASLAAGGLETVVFDGVKENPTTRCVDAAAAVVRAERIDVLVGLGGGSSLDTAKGANFLATNGGRMRDYWGVGKATKPMLPMIAVPTTAGTGSEAQSFALITDEETKQKMACGDKKCACKIALLDPELTLSQPARVTAVTGVDAVSHAVESYVTTRRTAVSRMFSREAWRALLSGLPRVLADPTDLEARGATLWGAYLAGSAIECSMLGAAHSLANPLTARHDVTHGVAIGVMLPHVIRYNDAVASADYAELERSAANGKPRTKSAGGAALAERIEELVASAGLPTELGSLGVPRGDAARLAEEAAEQWTARFNPRPVEKRDFEDLYAAAFR